MHVHFSFESENAKELVTKLSKDLLPLMEKGANIGKDLNPGAKVVFSLNATVSTYEENPFPMPVADIRPETPAPVPDQEDEPKDETPVTLDELMDIFKQVAAKHPDKSKKVKAILGKYTEDGRLGSLLEENYADAYVDAQLALKEA